MLRHKAKYFIEIIIHALFWIVVYYALNALTASSFNIVATNDGKISQAINGRLFFPYAALVLLVLMLLFYGYIFWLFKKVIRYKSTVTRVAVVASWILLLFTINYFLVRLQIDPTANPQNPGVSRPTAPARVAFSLDTLSGSPSDSIHDHRGIVAPTIPVRPQLKEFSYEDWWDMQVVMAIIFLAMLGIAVAYFFSKAWIRNDLLRSQATAQQLSTEVKFLRSQVNPHFLFNTLNNLFSMAQKKGNEEVADGISKLSGMMRYMIYESNTERVPLQKEVEYLQDCIALNILRFADNEVSVSFDHPAMDMIAGVQIAPMLLVPFLENAFKHGVSIGRNSSITMALSVNQKKLIFTCGNIDYSATKKLEEEKNGIGLENVKRRLQLVYPGKHTLEAGLEDGKYCVNLQIDLV